MKTLATLMLVLGALVAADAQSAADAQLQGQLAVPDCGGFSGGKARRRTSPRSADPKSGSQTILGYAFLTTELEPLERGYDGPIKILVGMDPKGILAGVVVIQHREPYGYFSVDTPQFAAQFVGKDIRDPFKLGVDVDAVSRATMSMTSSARAIKNSSRRVAKALLTPPAPDSEK